MSACKFTRGKIIALIVIIVGGIVSGTFYYLYHSSGNQADISLVDLTLEASNSQTFLNDLYYRKFKFILTYDELGGFVPVACKDFTLNIKIEDLEVGSIQIENFQITGWWKRNTETLLLDLSGLSSNDLNYVIDKFYDNREELMVEIECSARIDAVVLSKKVNPSITKFFLLGSPSIDIFDVKWDKKSAEAGESVDFHVGALNPYRGSPISGTLAVIVREDIAWWWDEDVKTYSFKVSLDAAQSSDYSDSFTVYKNSGTNGFFLKVNWQGTLIHEMSEGYPPRLKVS